MDSATDSTTSSSRRVVLASIPRQDGMDAWRARNGSVLCAGVSTDDPCAVSDGAGNRTLHVRVQYLKMGTFIVAGDVSLRRTVSLRRAIATVSCTHYDVLEGRLPTCICRQ